MLVGLDGSRAVVLWWTLPSYMMLIAVAFVMSAGILFWQTRGAWRLAQAANSALAALALGLIGARLQHVILYQDYFANNPAEILNLAAGGLSPHGAVVGAVIGGWLAARLYRKNFSVWLNAAAYAVCLIAIAAWWGCAAASCAYGAEIGNLADYPSWLVWEAQGDFLMIAPRYAVQPIGAVASAVLLGITLLAAWLGVQGRWRAVFSLTGILLIHFVLGFFRGDPAPILGGLRLSQALDLLLTAAAVLAAVGLRRATAPPA